MSILNNQPIHDSLFQVERNDETYQVKGRNFSNRVKLNDLILVERNGQHYKCSWNRLNNWNNLKDDDLILTEYNNEFYHVKGSVFKSLF